MDELIKLNLKNKIYKLKCLYTVKKPNKTNKAFSFAKYGSQEKAKQEALKFFHQQWGCHYPYPL